MLPLYSILNAIGSYIEFFFSHSNSETLYRNFLEKKVIIKKKASIKQVHLNIFEGPESVIRVHISIVSTHTLLLKFASFFFVSAVCNFTLGTNRG